MPLSLLVPWIIVGLCACAFAVIGVSYVRTRSAPKQIEATAPQPQEQRATVQVISGAVNVSRPNSHTVEGLEIRYGSEGLVRSVCVGAMNVEHKELLLVMDSVAWQTLPNSHKQEVLAAARSTWAAKMCPSGPDVAYVIVKTERGEVVGRADPRCVTLI